MHRAGRLFNKRIMIELAEVPTQTNGRAAIAGMHALATQLQEQHGGDVLVFVVINGLTPEQLQAAADDLGMSAPAESLNGQWRAGTTIGDSPSVMVMAYTGKDRQLSETTT